MKTLIVPYLKKETGKQDTSPLHVIDKEPWSKKPNLSCEAGFSISHFNDGICLKYSVIEPFLNVKTRKINGAVHNDNCVEFFLAFEGSNGYYNFEFNCLGSIKAAYGDGRQHRKFLPPYLLKPVHDSMEISLNNDCERNRIKWTLTVILPLSIFLHDNKKGLSGATCTANFTKCGDSLPNPHFLSWINLTSAHPDFHQPSLFGTLIFAPNNNNI